MVHSDAGSAKDVTPESVKSKSKSKSLVHKSWVPSPEFYVWVNSQSKYLEKES